MGFPTCTLVGMGAGGLGALLFIIIAYLALSPGVLLRLGLSGARLDLRVKSFIGYALACLLLMAGFFGAGVPLDGVVETAVPPTPINAQPEPESMATVIVFATPTIELTTAVSEASATNEGPASGAMGDPPPPNEEDTPDSGAFVPIGEEEVVSEEEATPSAEAGPSSTPTVELSTTPVAATVTPTPTPSPTITPTPTLTPTPIDGDTAVMALNGGVIWLRRSPGGQNLVILSDEDVVLLGNGRANRDGRIWREIITVDGVTGWIQEIYLNFEN